MGEGTYGQQPQQQQVLACGCVAACTCFDEPYQEASGLWYTQDASGHQYLWSGGGWVDASSPEATQVVADTLCGLLQPQETMQPWTNPASGAVHDPAAGAVHQPGGYWYAQGSDGLQYAWTSGGWVPAAGAGGYADPVALPAGPPAVGYGTSTDQTAAQLVATGDPIAIQVAEDLQRSEMERAAVWTGDRDMDGTPNENDPQPDNPDIETTGGFDPDPSVDTSSPFLDY